MEKAQEEFIGVQIVGRSAATIAFSASLRGDVVCRVAVFFRFSTRTSSMATPSAVFSALEPDASSAPTVEPSTTKSYLGTSHKHASVVSGRHQRIRNPVLSIFPLDAFSSHFSEPSFDLAIYIAVNSLFGKRFRVSAAPELALDARLECPLELSGGSVSHKVTQLIMTLPTEHRPKNL